MANNKHLTEDERNIIAERLKENKSFKSIGNELSKDPTTISKEVKKHTTVSQTGCSGKAYNSCKHRFDCGESFLCKECTCPKVISRCRFCNRCSFFCGKYEQEHCVRLKKPPYVCNGCPKRYHQCTLEKHLYVPRTAQTEYELSLHESRTGMALTEDEIKHLDTLFSPLLKKGQSIHHICNNHRDSIMVSESTVYRIVDLNLFEARNIDMPRKVRYRPRKRAVDFKVDKACRIGRTYEDYLAFISANPEIPTTQMDSVEGKKGGKVLLTIHFVGALCMLAFLRDGNDSQSVINIIDRLYLELGPDVFCTLMPLLLGDNGSEFSNPRALETDGQGNERTRVFYCDPYASNQKGSCERNHEFIRMFIPKGKSFDSYTQSDISLMMDHINSYKRPSLGHKSPYEMMEFMYGEKILSLLGLNPIEPDLVTLKKIIWAKGGGRNA